MTSYTVILEAHQDNMESPLAAAKATAHWLETPCGSAGMTGAEGAIYYISPEVDDGRIATEAMVAVDLQNLPEETDAEADHRLNQELVLVPADMSKLGAAVRKAATRVALDTGDELVVLPFGTELPGVQHDDGVTAIAAIDLVRALVASYEAQGEEQ